MTRGTIRCPLLSLLPHLYTDHGDDDALVETAEPEEEEREGSMRLGFGKHGSFFAGIGQRMLHSGVEECDDSTSTEEREYTDGYEIEHDGQHVCTIVRRLGKGAMGTVYLGQRREGTQFAVKAVSADKSPSEIAKMQGQLALETSIGFALGRHPLIATVIGVVVVLPDSKTTAKGLLLLCEKIDCGDLEEAMSTKAAVAKAKPDYAGKLWSEPSSTTWPLASITLQIFLGFHHVHERGILHQVRSSTQWICFVIVASSYLAGPSDIVFISCRCLVVGNVLWFILHND